MTATKNRAVDPHLPTPTKQRVLTVSLHRIRRGRAVAFAPDEPRPGPLLQLRPSRAAQMLALAHEFQRLIDDGEVADRATLAAEVGLTRARVTQTLDLLLLAPDIQEDILLATDIERSAPVTERQVRLLARVSSWSEQRRVFRSQAQPS